MRQNEDVLQVHAKEYSHEIGYKAQDIFHFVSVMVPRIAVEMEDEALDVHCVVVRHTSTVVDASK